MYHISLRKQVLYKNLNAIVLLMFSTDFIPDDAEYPTIDGDLLQLLLNENESLKPHIISQKIFEHFKKQWRSLSQVSLITSVGDMYSFKFDDQEKIIHK